MTTIRARALLAVATIAVAACAAADTTSPVAAQAPGVAVHDDVILDSVPDAHCRSGYATANGRCTG